MKIKLPENAIAKAAKASRINSIIKIPGLLGCEITGEIAKENGMDILTFCNNSHIKVYLDHVILSNHLIA